MKWNQAIKDYSHYLKIERGLSQNTIDNYCLDIHKLMHFLEQNSITSTPILIDHSVVQQFIYTIAKTLSARSQSRLISGLRSFF